MAPDFLVKKMRLFLTFVGVGAIGTFFHYTTLVGSVEWLHFKPLSGTVMGFLVGALVNYRLNYKYTFKSRADHYVAIPKFLAIAIVGFFINASIMKWGVGRLSIHYLLVQLFATSTVLIWNFAGSLLWAFRESHRGK